VHVPEIQLMSGEEDVVIDVLRHGQTAIFPFSPDDPGPPLSDLGMQQAEQADNQLFQELGPIAGLFSGTELRDLQTAAPLATLEQMTPQIVPGLNEVDWGIDVTNGQSLDSAGTLLALATVFSWAFGDDLLPLPGSNTYNGVVLDQAFNSAMDAMYNDVIDNPVVSDTGNVTGVAFDNGFDLFIWTMLNAKNPDLLYFIPSILKNGLNFFPNTADAVFSGNPEDGWTLDSWAGDPIPAIPDPLTELFVLTRDVTVPVQTAIWDVYTAFLNGDTTTIENAISTGINQVDTSIAQLPQDVTSYISEALGGDTPAATASAGAEPAIGPLLDGLNLDTLSTDVGSVLSTAAADISAVLPGELGTLVSNALASF
jgi:hypothetical protein